MRARSKWSSFRVLNKMETLKFYIFEGGKLKFYLMQSLSIKILLSTLLNTIVVEMWWVHLQLFFCICILFYPVEFVYPPLHYLVPPLGILFELSTQILYFFVCCAFGQGEHFFSFPWYKCAGNYFLKLNCVLNLKNESIIHFLLFE